MESSSALDLADQMGVLASSLIPVLVNFVVENHQYSMDTQEIHRMSSAISNTGFHTMTYLRESYLLHKDIPSPASHYLGRTRDIYDFIRINLQIPMHGAENLQLFKIRPEVSSTIGHHVSRIYSSVMAGEIYGIVATMISGMC